MATKITNTTAQLVKYRGETVKIQTITIAGVECLSLKDVQRRFPMARVLCIDDIQQTFIRDENGNDLEPLRIVANADKIVEAVDSYEDSNQDISSRLDRIESNIKNIQAKAEEILLQNEYVMTETFELHEFTAPRHFFILPTEHNDNALPNVVQNLLHAHYKLYFLCECSHEPNKMHIVDPRGYSIKKPREFIVKYAPYLSKTLNIAQWCLSAGSLFIPGLGIASSIIQHVLQSQPIDPKHIKKMKKDLNMVKSLIDEANKKESQGNNEVLNSQKSRVPSLKGIQLREIQTYLEGVDGMQGLGNLYRTVTDDGHVRWVCLEHYDQNSYNELLEQNLEKFQDMGGTFNKKTKEACVTNRKVNSENFQTIYNTIEQGLNITQLTFQDCRMAKNDLKKLLGLILNCSSINRFVIDNLICKSSDEKKYSCKYMVAEISHLILKIQFSDANPNENIWMLTQLLEQNKRKRVLDLNAQDFPWHEPRLQTALDNRESIKGFIIKHCNTIDILHTLFNLKTTELQLLQFTHSLCNGPTLLKFCEMLKKNKTLVGLDLMDSSGFEDEKFLTDLLDIVKHHDSIKYLCLHIRNMQPSDRKDVQLQKCFRKHKFIKQLCVSSSIISQEFTEAVCYSLKEYENLIDLEFYNCQINDEDRAQLQSLRDNGTLPELKFYDKARWDVMFSEPNMSQNRVIPNIPANAKWKRNGISVAKQLNKPCALVVDDNQTIVIADRWNNRIVQCKKGDVNGKVIAGVKGKGNRLNQLYLPVDVLIDKETNSLIIADNGNRRVLRWSRLDDTEKGEILIDNVLCTGLAMDDQRYLYISDYEKHEVRRYGLGDKNGTLIIGGNGQGDGPNQLNEPGFLFVDRQQNVYVSDERNHRVLKWNQNTKEVIVVAGGKGPGDAMTQLANPNGIFVDTFGTLYVADAVNHRVVRWSPGDKQGTVIVGENGEGTADNQFKSPRGLSFDLYGNLYVVDRGNHRVQRFDIELSRLKNI